MGATACSEARVTTAAPRRYLGQLCKHFQHKLPVELSETQGRIDFPMGVCTLDAEALPGALLMCAAATDEASLTRLEEVVGRHLERFAFREPLTVLWVRPDECTP
ncbi:DUF2218 domain-containing protein [Roseomonas sp. CAU 1739]|uniref:DUF2218 domain-containing protein n=1 Tax=Roseomonas sp. CAU 1739 TaxID=3140364 RepID=UPI00325C192B